MMRIMVWGDVVPLGTFPSWEYKPVQTNAEIIAEARTLMGIIHRKCVYCGQARTGKPSEDAQHDVGPRGSVSPYCSQPEKSFPDHRRMCMGCGFPHAFNYHNCVWDRP